MIPNNIQAAAVPKAPVLSVTKATVTVGDTKHLTVKNRKAGAKYAWSTSNKKVAEVTSKGLVKTVNAGEATIRCKVTVNKKVYNLKSVITVSTTDYVTTQSGLDRALKNVKVRKIELSTKSAKSFTIKEGNYYKKDLAVNAPNSDMVNYAKFKSISIKAIKSDTWTEKAVGNSMTVSAPEARIGTGTGIEYYDTLQEAAPYTGNVIRTHYTAGDMGILAEPVAAVDGVVAMTIPAGDVGTDAIALNFTPEATGVGTLWGTSKFAGVRISTDTKELCMFQQNAPKDPDTGLIFDQSGTADMEELA